MKQSLDELFLKEGFEPQLIEELKAQGKFKTFKKDEYIIKPGGQVDFIPLVINGAIKVMRNDADDGEVLLYYLEGGEPCAMSISCCLENRKSQFSAVVEEDCELLMLPMNHLDIWIAKYPAFRRHIFRAYQSRFDELLNAIDSMVFMNMEERLYNYLLDKKQLTGSFTINKTHQQIAQELNTSRVVISRLLKKLENDEKIEQYRNRIEIL
ncbi:MAG TPA: Crp/Fnr family transcriptional regulator [Fulvivirga sp.]|nr:Crp/Fnr family transcriptional regulator [Fulvivirga sp.]